MESGKPPLKAKTGSFLSRRGEGARADVDAFVVRTSDLPLWKRQTGKRGAPGNFEPNPLYDHCRAILTQELFRSWSGVIFRSVSPRYAKPINIVSGYGSYRAGGRWNAPGIYAFYGSMEPGLAADESFNFLLQHFGWQNRDIPPRMVVGIRVTLQAVLDLTNPASVLHQLNLEELLSEDWRKMNGQQKESGSQALGRAVAELGEGIVAPSRIPTGERGESDRLWRMIWELRMGNSGD